MRLTSDLKFFREAAEIAAPQLLGCVLVRDINGKIITVRIVEVEAYGPADAASHSFNGKTVRNSPMFAEAGTLYVYFTYGMHYCANIVTGSNGEGSAVLIRAVEPVSGHAEIAANRPHVKPPLTTNGPGKLCQALLIDKFLSGHDLSKSPLILRAGKLKTPETIIRTTRIGITKATNLAWRFYIKNNMYVSKK